MINGKVLFVAVHTGPYLSIKPLRGVLGKGDAIFLLDGMSQKTCRLEKQSLWNFDQVITASGSVEQFLLDFQIKAIVIGTSDGLPHGNIEERTRRAGGRVSVPVFVIEDFPGNYRHDPDGRLDGLFVEDMCWSCDSQFHEDVRNLVHCTGNPRYDVLRTLDRKELRTSTRTRLGIRQQTVALWAGQPDNDNSYRALERLVPYLSGKDLLLLFKAHPRDALYRNNIYDRLLSRLSAVIDVTSEEETIGLCCAADLVMTQFSSVGVEASYLHTPTLYALFDDLGKVYLKKHKGYTVVPWARRECAFLLESESPVRETLEVALLDSGERERVQTNFMNYYGARPESTHAIATVMGQTLAGYA